MELKQGMKVKVPKTKSVRDWGSIKESNAVRIANEIKQDYLYINSVEDDIYGIWYAEGEEADYFLKNDLELYGE